MSAIDNYCLLPNSVPSLPGPACSFFAPNPNATILERLSQCCNGAELHFIGNGTSEVPAEKSCISWCSYPAYTGNYTTLARAGKQWNDCIGGGTDGIVTSATCQGAKSDNGQTTPSGAAAMRIQPVSSGSAAVLLTLGVLSLAIPTLITA